MSVKKTILTEKSYKDLIDYVNKVEFFKDFISVINPNKYEIITDSDIESSAASFTCMYSLISSPSPRRNIFLVCRACLSTLSIKLNPLALGPYNEPNRSF